MCLDGLTKVYVVSQSEPSHLAGKWWVKVKYINDDKTLDGKTVLCFNYKHEACRDMTHGIIYI